MRLDAEVLQDAVIGAHGFLGADLAVGDQTQEADKSELIFRIVDLAAKQGDAGAVLLRLAQQFEGVVGRAGRAAEDADDEMRIVVNQLLHRLRAVVDHLQEQRPALARDAAERADDGVVDEAGQLARLDRLRPVGVEHFEEVAEALALGLQAELLVLLQGGAVQHACRC